MRRSILVLGVLLLVGCSASLLPPDTSNVERARSLKSSVTLQELHEGYRAYRAKCGGCHGLYLPSEYTAEQWSSHVSRMARKSRLVEGEEQMIILYLSSAGKKD